MDPLVWPCCEAVAVVLGCGLLMVGLIHLVHRLQPHQIRHLCMRATVMAGVVIGVVAAAGAGRWVLTPLVLAVAAGCWFELLRAVAAGHRGLLTALGTVGVLAGGVGATFLWPWMAGLVALLVPIVATRRTPPLVSFLAVAFGTMVITMPLALYLSIGYLSFAHYAFIFMVISAHDSFAVGLGKLSGRRALWLHISPNKTVEGSLGGWVSALLAAWGIHFLLPHWTLPETLGMATILSILADLGDLLASCVKRETGVKDFGTIIPTQGGVLDRFDSLLLAVPVYYVLMMWHGV